MWNGELIRESTKQRNDKVARQMEAAERTRLAKELDERKAVQERLNCKKVVPCPECNQWFDAATTIRDTLSNKQFCSDHCRDTWTRKYRVVPTLEDFCETRVKPFAKSTYEQAAKKTYAWYLFAIGSLTCSSLAKLRLDEIRTERVSEFISELRIKEKNRAKGKKLQLATINSVLRGLRRVLRLAVEWEVIESAPRIKMQKGERQRERVLTIEEENLYLAGCTPLLHDVSLVLFDTGMRPEECHRMRWENINWAGGRNGVVLIENGKTKAARRFLPITQRVRLMLEQRCKNAGEPAEGWVWPSQNKDGHINHDTLKLAHKKAVQLSKVRAFDVYSIRHSCLTRLGEAGCDVYTLCRIAGWSNIKMALRYVHPSDDAVLNAFARLGSQNALDTYNGS
jgi:integrase